MKIRDLMDTQTIFMKESFFRVRNYMMATTSFIVNRTTAMIPQII